MKLKDVIRADVSRVFLNTDDFAEQVTLCGRLVNAVVEHDDSKHSHLRTPDVGLRSLVLNIATNDVPPECLTGTSLFFEGENWIIDTRHDEYGLTTLHLSLELLYGGGATCRTY